MIFFDLKGRQCQLHRFYRWGKTGLKTFHDKICCKDGNDIFMLQVSQFVSENYTNYLQTNNFNSTPIQWKYL